MLKKIFKSKRGIAIETAILFMIVIFFFCALITSLTLFGFSEIKLEKELLQRDVEIDQIGEHFLASVQTGVEFELDNEKYAYDINGNVLTVRYKNSEAVVLYVEAELSNGQLNVIAWRYPNKLPTQTE